MLTVCPSFEALHVQLRKAKGLPPGPYEGIIPMSEYVQNDRRARVFVKESVLPMFDKWVTQTDKAQKSFARHQKPQLLRTLVTHPDMKQIAKAGDVGVGTWTANQTKLEAKAWSTMVTGLAALEDQYGRLDDYQNFKQQVITVMHDGEAHDRARTRRVFISEGGLQEVQNCRAWRSDGWRCGPCVADAAHGLRG